MAHDRQAKRRLAAFKRDRRAVAAVEFTIIFPVLLVMMAGAFELSRAVQTARQLATLANSISTMLAATTAIGTSSGCPDQSGSDGCVTFIDLHYAFDSAMLIFPPVLSDSKSRNIAWGNDISISMAGVSFTVTVPGCTSGCTYKANIVWTGAAAQRACGSNLTSAPDTAAPTSTTLPQDLFTPVTTPTGTAPPLFAIVVDVGYAWTPLIFSGLIGPITMQRSAYVTPRYVSQIKYSAISGDDQFGKQCPGF